MTVGAGLVAGASAAAYSLRLGTFRGGPAFPAVSALAIGMAAGVTGIGLPVTRVVVVAVVGALVIRELLDSSRPVPLSR